MIAKKVFAGIILAVVSLWSLAACAFFNSGAYLPAVWYLNMSDDVIYNINLNWGGEKFIPIGGKIGGPLKPGGEPSQLMWIDHKNDAFGKVILTWENAKHEKFKAEMQFTKEDFPGIEKKGANDNIAFEFYQDGMVYFIFKSTNEQERWRMNQKIRSCLRMLKIIDKEKKTGKYTNTSRGIEKINVEELKSLRAEYQARFLVASKKYSEKVE